MKTIKISELKESTSFKDLYTIGTDENNKSVKISLESIDTYATEALETAKEASATATDAKDAAEQAVKDAQEAIENAQTAADRANEAAEAAEKATENADEIIEEIEDTIRALVPTSMELDYPKTITLENTVQQKVGVQLYPESVMQNVIFMCDHTSIDVGLKGEITILGAGTTKVRVIPTCNTALAQEISITVIPATIRLVTKSSLRFAESGVMRLN